MNTAIHETHSITEVAEHIYRIPVPLPGNPLKVLNSYLIRDGKHSLLIDTGFRIDVCREALLAGLQELGQDPADMDIFITHLHSDHSGLAAELIGPGRSIYISETDMPALAQPEIMDAHWKDNERRFREAAMPEAILALIAAANPATNFAPPPGCRQYVPIRDGCAFSIAGYRLRCLWTPGHTPGHMCLWDEEKGLLFTGDHVLFDITPNITAWPFVKDSLGNYLNSLKAVEHLPVKTALPSHRASGDFHARVQALQVHHQNRLAEALSIIAAHPGSTAYDIAGRMTWSIRARSWEEFPVAQKIFALGECLSHLDHLLINGRIRIRTENSVHHYYTTDQ